jgi:hypothetical protein
VAASSSVLARFEGPSLLGDALRFSPDELVETYVIEVPPSGAGTGSKVASGWGAPESESMVKMN